VGRPGPEQRETIQAGLEADAYAEPLPLQVLAYA
jgi:hypothetical protein